MVEGEPMSSCAGDVVRVAPEVRRQLVNRGPGELRLLALGGYVDHEHEPRDGRRSPPGTRPSRARPRRCRSPEDLPAADLA